MGIMGTCGHCGHEWYSVHNAKIIHPVGIPTCSEGEILTVCRDCFDLLPSSAIIAIAKEKQRASDRIMHASARSEPGVKNVYMSPTEYTLVDAAIAGWVPYLKGEIAEPPFEQEAFKV